jgi:DNA mismatch endonuclease, patch repair protein
MDSFTKEVRSRVMSKIGSKNTKPEMKVRSLLHSMGYRFRLHDKRFPGKPDLVMKKHFTVIFVNGCFWHRHPGCKYAAVPKSNCEYWDAKLEGNVLRDRKNMDAINDKGWKCFVIWECETRSLKELEERIRAEIK